MVYRYPYDPNDPHGEKVEQNNSMLVDENGTRVAPAIRPAQDSDPCCDAVINAPAKQLRDRLALLEAKTPLMGEAAAINDGDLALQGNITVQGKSCAVTRSIEISASSQNWEDLGETASPRFWLHELYYDQNEGRPAVLGAVVMVTGDANYTADADGRFYAANGTTLLGSISFSEYDSANGFRELFFRWTNKFNGSLTYATGGSEVVEGVVSARRMEADAVQLTSGKSVGSVVYTNTLAADGKCVTFTRAEELSGNYQQDVRFSLTPQYDSANGARIECVAQSFDADGVMQDDLGVALQAEKLRVNEIYEPINGQAGQICVHSELQVNGPVRTTGDVTAGGAVTAGGDVAVTGDITASGDIMATGKFAGTITGNALKVGRLEPLPGGSSIALNAMLNSLQTQSFAQINTDTIAKKTGAGAISVNSALNLGANLLTAPNCVKGWGVFNYSNSSWSKAAGQGVSLYSSCVTCSQDTAIFYVAIYGVPYSRGNENHNVRTVIANFISMVNGSKSPVFLKSSHGDGCFIVFF